MDKIRDRGAAEAHLTHYIANPRKLFVLEGLRQIGKTTLVRRVVAPHPHVYLTFTDEEPAIQAIRAAETFSEFTRLLTQFYRFVPNRGQILVLDEAQRSQTLYRFIPQMEREWAGTAVVLLGSVMGAFFNRPDNEVQITPAGRIQKQILRPFSFFEFLNLAGHDALGAEILSVRLGARLSEPFHREAQSLVASYLGCGGFPEAIALRQSSEDVYRYYSTLLGFIYQDADRYLEEMLGESRRHYSVLLEAVLKAVGQHTGDFSKRSSLVSTDSPAYRYEVPALLDAISTWHLLFKLKTDLKSLSAQPGKASKKYVADVGLLNHLVRRGMPIANFEYETDPFISRLLESFVCQELVVLLEDAGRLATWRSSQKQNHELDFVAYFSTGPVAVEVKTSAKVSQHALSQLREFIAHHRAKRAFVVYTGQGETTTIDGCSVYFIPPYLVGNLKRWVEEAEII